MMAGQAILAIAPEDSDLVDLIKKAECGWWVEPGDVDGLENAIQAISDDPKELLACRERAYQFAQMHYGQADLAREWAALLEQLDV
jgi:glycosyltransferase involved in cell wall biosynthesis